MRELTLGNEEAVRVLYARFSRPVYTLGRRLLGTPEAAEELTQDVFTGCLAQGPAVRSRPGTAVDVADDDRP